MTRGQVNSVAAIAAREQSSRATVIRRLLTDGLRLHQRIQQLREAEGVDAP
jgi:hypothetical protein